MHESNNPIIIVPPVSLAPDADQRCHIEPIKTAMGSSSQRILGGPNMMRFGKRPAGERCAVYRSSWPHHSSDRLAAISEVGGQ